MENRYNNNYYNIEKKQSLIKLDSAFDFFKLVTISHEEIHIRFIKT